MEDQSAAALHLWTLFYSGRIFSTGRFFTHLVQRRDGCAEDFMVVTGKSRMIGSDKVLINFGTGAI
jgi:hypothetical protein